MDVSPRGFGPRRMQEFFVVAAVSNVRVEEVVLKSNLVGVMIFFVFGVGW